MNIKKDKIEITDNHESVLSPNVKGGEMNIERRWFVCPHRESEEGWVNVKRKQCYI